MRPWADAAEIFRHRRARSVAAWERVVLGILLFLGIQSIVYFADWWFRLDHINNLVLFILLSAATWYGISRLVVGWYNAFHIEQPEIVQAEPGLRVAIFTTSSPGEPYEMFVRTLDAARKISYPHTTYLLDDARDPRLAELAKATGTVHLEIVGEPGAKAGKINRALRMTDEDFILVLDPDHIPFPEFLDRVLGYFQDEKIGFVQVAQAYYNAPQSWVAHAASEQTFTFYGPTMQGMHGTGTAVAIGANCTFRRAALESIGGHGLGLAEDLVTSIRLHAAGWRSVYVPEIVSRGLVPADLESFLRQQLKWSRGVHDVLFHEYPRAFRRLTAHQKISYLMIGSYYLVGLTTLIYLAIPLIYLWFGEQPAVLLLAEYIQHALPIGVIGAVIYRFVQRWLCDPVRERGWHWRGTLLKIGTWNVFLRGLWLAVRGVTVPYIPTRKERHRGRFWSLARTPLVVIGSSVVTIVWTVFRQLYLVPEAEVLIATEVTVGMVAFLLMNVVLMSGRVYAAWVDSRREDE